MNLDNQTQLDDKLLKLLKIKITDAEAANVKTKLKGDTAMARLIKEIIEETIKDVN